jgi:poly(3-hydroxybutyrate) depolymerase
MKKIILAILLLALGLLASWLLYFQPRGYSVAMIKDRVAFVVSGKGSKKVRAQRMMMNPNGGSSMGPSQDSQQQQQQVATEISSLSFLENIAITAESEPVNLSFTYSNNGTLSTRQFFVSVPEGFVAAKGSSTQYPVCFAFHGTAKNGASAGASAAQRACSGDIGCGCICIAPVGGVTSDGACSWNANNSTTEDDLEFVQSMWNTIKDDSRIDLSRVYAYGHSVGSLFVSNILAPQANFFTGFCCYSSQLMESTDISNAQKPMNIVYFNGDADPMIPFGGGSASFNKDLIFKSIQDTALAWSDHNGCSGSLITEENDSYTEYSYDCGSSVVASYLFKGVPHNSVEPITEYFDVSTAGLALQLFSGS